MDGLHGQEIEIGGNSAEALRIVDSLNEQARKRREEIGKRAVNNADMGIDMPNPSAQVPEYVIERGMNTVTLEQSEVK